MSFISKLFSGKNLKRLEGVVLLINNFEEKIKALSDADLKSKSAELKDRILQGTPEEDIIPEAFALVREAAWRTMGQRHFDVQFLGGLVLNEGKIAEMLTGEGKTLTATLAAYANALRGEGVHIVTVNEYLAKRDTVWMGQVYSALGLRVSCLVHSGAFIYDPDFTPGEETSEEKSLDKERDLVGGFRVVEKFLRPITRQEAYKADITYGTNHEFGFDFLRDNLVMRLGDRVGRGHPYAIIDEVDSILIDEARTPLIIAAPDQESSQYYKVFAKVVTQLDADEDYVVDEKLRSVNITEPGIEKVEKAIDIPNIFAPEHSRLVHFLQESLRAKALYKRDKDYVVKSGEVIIVDEFTGRMLPGRRYSGGLHQAIEAKEGVAVRQENRTYAQITIQNYFRLYKKIAGMTGTAQTSAEEFHKVYNLEVVSVPPNKPMVRKDEPDLIYKTRDAKYRAVVEEVKRAHDLGQPILLGTSSISNNELISGMLTKAGVSHEVLNAKNNEREGAIIAQAGRLSAVTVATNMAGRGVDIIFGGNPPSPEEAQKIRDLGGLYVVGTERHESRRIDNQLRGRSGRQGDPGKSKFFLSLEDDLLRIFGGEKIGRLMQTLNFPEDTPIEAGMVSKAVNQAQAKVEGFNLDMRRHLLDFDDVLNKQRSAVYSKRALILEAAEKNTIRGFLLETLNSVIDKLKIQVETLPEPEKIAEEKKKIEAFGDKIKAIKEGFEPERAIALGYHLVRILDMLWVNHLENLEALRESVNIRAYGQHEPLVEYRKDAHMLYQNLNRDFEMLVLNTVWPILETNMENIKEQNKPRIVPPPEAKNICRNDPCYCGAVNPETGQRYKYKKCGLINAPYHGK